MNTRFRLVLLLSMLMNSIALWNTLQGQEVTDANTVSVTKNLNLQDNERRLVSEALNNAHGDVTAAAKRLGISGAALRRKLAQYKLPLQAIAQGQKSAVEDSSACIVKQVYFSVTPNVYQRVHPNSDELACGKITKKCCVYRDQLQPGEHIVYKSFEKGVLEQEPNSLHFFMCQVSESNKALVDITWAVLEDVYGAEAIPADRNNIPPFCRLHGTFDSKTQRH